MADHSRTPRRRGKAKSTQGDQSVDDEGFPPVVPEQPPVVKSTYKPRYNEAFMETLMNLEAMYNLKWGDVSYADVFESMLLRQRDHECRMKDDWVECGLAIRSGKKLRLVPSDWSIAGRPAYGMPKLIRYAVLLGMGYMEFDLVASHPRQILKYAKSNSLETTALLAIFGSRASIKRFRVNLAQEMNLPESEIKLATNMLCYGSGLKDWMAKHGVEALPPMLQQLKLEVAAVRDHYWANCEEAVKVARLSHKHPSLAALSVMCQTYEHIDLDICIERLPQGTVLMGFLNDSFLCMGQVGEAYINALEAEDILLEVKGMPSTEAEYMRLFQEKTGVDLDMSKQVNRKEGERRKARAIAREVLFGNKKTTYLRDLDIVMGMSDKLPVNLNKVTKLVEVYEDDKGRWLRDGRASVTLQLLSKLLMETYFPVALESRQTAEGKMKLVPVRASWGVDRFRTGRFLALLEKAVCGTSDDLPRLDYKVDTQLHFDEPICMDVSKKNPKPTDFTDSLVQGLEGTAEEIALLKQILAPVRRTTKYDRNTRWMPHRWKLYPKWREMLKLVPLSGTSGAGERTNTRCHRQEVRQRRRLRLLARAQGGPHAGDP